MDSRSVKSLKTKHIYRGGQNPAIHFPSSYAGYERDGKLVAL